MAQVITKITDDEFEILTDSLDKIKIKTDTGPTKIKLNRWDEEVSLIIDLDEPDAKLKLNNNKLKWKSKAKNHDYELFPKDKDVIGNTNEEGGFEFNVILDSIPLSNVFSYPITLTGLVYYKQPYAPDPDAIDPTLPDYVKGSYAIYHESKQGDYTLLGGKNYKVGKAFHIYRPLVTDDNGDTVWGELNIDDITGVLTITIDQTWLNNADYPVTIDPNFGYEVQGSINDLRLANYLIGMYSSSPADVGVATLIKAYTRTYLGTHNIKGVLSLTSSKTIIANGVTAASVLSTTAEWKTMTYAVTPTLTPSVGYMIGMISDYYIYRYYDNGAANTGWEDTTNSYAVPQDPGSAANNTKIVSIYVTYDVGVAPTRNTRQTMNVHPGVMWRVMGAGH